MNQQSANHAPRSVTSIWPPVVLLVFGVVALVVALSYPRIAAQFPAMVAGVLILLTIFDIWSRTGLPGAGLVETFGGTSFRRREMMHNPTFANQIECIGWILGAFALMATIGILAASPVFAAGYVWFRGGRSLFSAGIVGIVVLAFEFAVFEWALDYELYRGLFFTKGGVSAW